MTLNLAKCELDKPEVKFVGRLVESGNHRPDLQRLQGLAKIEVPRTKKKLRDLLGFFCYYRKCISHFLAIAIPLTVPNFVAITIGSVGEKMQLAAFDGPFSKTPYRRKNLAKISYASRVIAHYVPNFVAMATKESPG